jgi:nicotinamidase-related amidase
VIESEFLVWLESRKDSRESLALESLLERNGGADGCVVTVVDLVEGFCRVGSLASPLIADLIQPTLSFLARAEALGVSRFLFPCDAHQPDSREFAAFGPHCIAGTRESEIVAELTQLEFSHLFRRIDKGSVSSLTGTGLAEQLASEETHTIICLGDCTDLCLYHLAVGLRFFANHHGLDWDIVVPQELVATYDLPLEVAEEIGALPHPAALLNKLFLYHLELNGVRVVRGL